MYPPTVIFWVKSYNVKGKPLVFSVPEINIIPLGVSLIVPVFAFPLATSRIQNRN